MLKITTALASEVKLSAALTAKLLVKLDRFALLKLQIDDAKAEQDQIKDDLEMAFIDADAIAALEAGLRVGDYPVKYVRGTKAKLDKKKFVGLGGSLAMLEQATVISPSKGYLKITTPGGSDDE